MKVALILDFPSQTPCLAKFLFWSYCPNCSWPIGCKILLNVISVKKLRDQVDFLFADKHQGSLWVSAIASGGCGQACPNQPK